jgi:hypothetical protein
MSEKLNSPENWEAGNTFVQAHGVMELDYMERLVKVCYFQLTTLSTVGYGDLYPISQTEQIVTLIIMMGGVGFFSFIMGKFMEIINNYQIKMGVEDKTKELMLWLTELQKFTQGSKAAGMPIRLSLINNIIQNMNYYWSNDRLAWMRDELFEPLPLKVK